MSGIFGHLNLDAASGTSPALGPRAVHHAQTGCLIIADARIDYRDELCRALALDPRAVGDAELILAAYLRWGEACLDRLLGDFAFAIWDVRTRKLFCARDHFGMRPFYYHHSSGAGFVFASDARALFTVPEVPYRIYEGRVADFLVPELEWIDYTSTFYEGVHRLPPGHRLTVTHKGLDLVEFWEPEPGPAPSEMTDLEWIDGLREVLTRAVDERLRAPTGAVGCMLSGGMDSGSVAALARDLLESREGRPLRTFSAALGPADDCDETRRIHATVAQLHAKATLILPDDIGGLDDELRASIEDPFDGVFLFMKAIFLAARDAGVEVLLDGGGGDVVLNPGAYITRLIRHGHLVTAVQEILAEPNFWDAPARFPELTRHLLKAVTPELVKSAVRPRRQRAAARRFTAASLISQDFAQQVRLDERCERMYQMFPAGWVADPAAERIRKVRPNVSAGRERYQRLAKYAGLETRDPYLDLNVVRFCAHLPGHMVLRDGWPKWILRQAMAGRLPDAVRWGRGKPHVGWVFSERFLRRELARGNLSLERLGASLGGRIDGAKLEGAWRSFLQGDAYEAVERVYVLSTWLNQVQNRPIAKNQALG